MINKIKKKFSISLKGKRNIKGFFFVLPFLMGFVAFVLAPLVQSLIFSLSDLSITAGGYELNFVGLNNYRYSVFEHAEFNRTFVESFLDIIINLPAVIIFSFFAATLLNQKFKGRFLARVIFFLPVILLSGEEVGVELPGYAVAALENGALLGEGAEMFGGELIYSFLTDLRLPVVFIDYIIDAVNRLPVIIENAAIPIIIFLAGLQSIPASLYESAEIDGATAWESFWKITFPLLSPLFMTNVVYIVVDSFTALDNPIVELIQSLAWGRGIYGATVAMSWLYFLAIGVVLIIIFIVLSRYVVFMD